jgi:hypothetical protein
MIVRKGMVGMAAAVLAMGSSAWANDATTQPVASQVSVSPISADLSTEKPLQQEMDKAGIKNLPFSIQGFVEAGYMYDTSSPRIADGPTFNGYDAYKNRLELANADLQIIRTPTASGTKFDWGFTLEGGYGSDYTFIHSNGMMDNRAGVSPQNQSDIDQAFLSFNIPVLSGVTLNVGKFFTPLGYEVFDDGGNPLYSHSYAFLYAIPVTQTGITAQTTFGNWEVLAGITRGWDQSLKDSNGDPDFLGQVIYTPNKTWNVTANLSEGPEAPHIVGPADDGIGHGDDSHWWTVLDLVGHYNFSDQLTFGAGADYGDAPHDKFASSTGAAEWYGVTGYAGYTINSYLTANARLEWYDDTDGATLAGVHTSVYSATAGVTIKPLPNSDIFQYLEIRPEVRYDYSTKPIFDSGDHGQFNLASDVIMQF